MWNLVQSESSMGPKLKGCGSCLLFIVTTIVVYKLSLPVFLENFDPEGDTPSDNRGIPKVERTYQGRQLLCHKFEGGLGDLLFQYASLLGMTRDQNRLFMASGELGLLKALKNAEFRVGQSHCRGVVKLTERACCHFDDNLVQLDYKKNYNIEGYLQSWKYFKGMDEYLRSQLALKQEFIEKAASVIQRTTKGRSEDLIHVGIHIETGTLHAALFKQFGYKVIPVAFFQKAMNHFREKFKGNVLFFVVSDDRYWLWKHMKSSKDTVILEYLEPEVSLALLSLMKHCIISSGPLSWWGGYLSGGHVLYFKDFVREDAGLMYNKEKLLTDYIFPGWIPIT